MKHVHTCERFEDDGGWLEIRIKEDGSVTGHWKAWDGQTYHNTAPLTSGEEIDEAGVVELAKRAAKDRLDKDEVANMATGIYESIRRLRGNHAQEN